MRCGWVSPLVSSTQFGWVLVLSFGFAVAGQAQTTLDRTERRFIEATAETSHTDVAVAQLAVDRAQDSRVSDLACILGRDWTDLAVEAGTLAQATNQPLENDLVGDRVYRGLSETTDGTFDHHFVVTAIKRCKQQIEHLQSAGQQMADPRIKQFAHTHLAILRRDLAQLLQLQAALPK